MIQRLGRVLARWANKYIPDPFIFAALLTFVTLAMGLLLTGSGPLTMLESWGKGFWELLTFGMQMCLILVTGHALATSGPVRKGIERLSDLPKSGAGAAMLIAVVACLTGLLNWGLGIISGALLAREVARRGKKRGIPMHYPLLGAAGYAGLVVWHGGFSGSVPLLIATKDHFLQDKLGVIDISQTLFSPLNIAVAAALLVTVPLVCRLLHPKDPGEIVEVDAFEECAEPVAESKLPAPRTAAEWLERTRILSVLVSAMGLVWVGVTFWQKGFKLDINLVNFIFLFAGIGLHQGLIGYVRAVGDGARSVAGIILQFPFYAGIMGMMKYSGLAKVMSEAFASVSTGYTLPVVTFFSAGLVNIFVPSGGGQWAVQGPIIVDAAKNLGADMDKTIMALAYGDEWTNMFQPFWALALLGITGLKARDIMGYTMCIMFVTGVVFVGLLLLPF